MAYIKVNKDKARTFNTDMSTVKNDLSTILNGIVSFCDKYRNVDPDKIVVYAEKEVERTDDEGKTFWEWVTYKAFDWTSEYKKYQETMDKIKTEANTAKGDELVDATNMSNAIAGLISLIDEFDMAEAFNLADAYQGNGNITISTNAQGDTVLYYLDAEGNEVSLQQLLNAFYTQAGMSMEATMQGYLFATENGIEFNAEYQQQILDGVNATVDSIKDVGGFGVASEQDIIDVNSALTSSDVDFQSFLAFDTNGNLIKPTAGAWSSNMEVGSLVLNAYTMTDYINAKPLTSEVTPGTGTVTEGGTPTGGGMPTGTDETITDNGVPTLPGGGMPTVDDQTTDPIAGETLPGGEETTPEVPEAEIPIYERIEGMLKVPIKDIMKIENIEDLIPALRTDFDEMARHELEIGDPEVNAGYKVADLQLANDYMDNNVGALGDKLKDMGYTDNDINKFIDVTTGTVRDRDAVEAAFVHHGNEQRVQERAQAIAQERGHDYTPSSGKPSYNNIKNGSNTADLANRSNDPNVKQATEKYNKAETNLNKATTDVNRAADDYNEAAEEAKKIVETKGEDTSNWTEKDVEEYNEAIDNVQEAKENYEDKKDAYDDAKEEYDDALEELEDEYEDYEERVKEGASEEQVKHDARAEEDYREVSVEDEKVIETLGGETSQSDSGSSGLADVPESHTAATSASTPATGESYAGTTTDVALSQTSTEVPQSGLSVQSDIAGMSAEATGIIQVDNVIVEDGSPAAPVEVPQTETVTQQTSGAETQTNTTGIDQNQANALAMEDAQRQQQKKETASTDVGGSTPEVTVQNTNNSNEKKVSLSDEALLNIINNGPTE